MTLSTGLKAGWWSILTCKTRRKPQNGFAERPQVLLHQGTKILSVHICRSTFPLFKAGSSSLGGACLTADVTIKPCSASSWNQVLLYMIRFQSQNELIVFKLTCCTSIVCFYSDFTFGYIFYDQHAVMLFLEVNCNYSDDNSVFEIF